jgi:hypothetical protein
MKNRPNKSGYWWYKLNSTTHAVVYIRHCLAGGLMAEDRGRVVPLVEFEEGVEEWIGPAHPPKLEPATVHEMVSQWIARNGADGLWNEEGPCGCDGSAPCGDGPYPECKAAMAGGHGIDADGQDVDVLYYPIKIKIGDENG